MRCDKRWRAADADGLSASSFDRNGDALPPATTSRTFGPVRRRSPSRSDPAAFIAAVAGMEEASHRRRQPGSRRYREHDSIALRPRDAAAGARFQASVRQSRQFVPEAGSTLILPERRAPIARGAFLVGEPLNAATAERLGARQRRLSRSRADGPGPRACRSACRQACARRQADQTPSHGAGHLGARPRDESCSCCRATDARRRRKRSGLLERRRPDFSRFA